MIVPEFDESLLTGQPLIDEQHRWLFTLAARVAQRLGACELDGPAPDPVFAPSDPCSPRISDGAAEAVYGLLDYVTEHFSDEETLMSDSGYPAANYHASLHADLNRRLAPFVISEANAEPVDAEKLVEFFIDWLTTHILHHDREFTTWLAGNFPAVG